MNKTLKILGLIVTSFLVVSCGGGQETEPAEKPHEHTFSSEWTTNETSHWHVAECEHTTLTSELGEHTYGSDHKCTVCGYTQPLNKYLVSFNTNAGSYIPSYLGLEGSTILEPEAPTKDTYTFYGWYDNPEFNGDKYNFSTKLTGDITLYARWGHLIKYINYDGSTYFEEILLEGDVTERIQDPLKENETFIAWYEDESFEGEQFVFGEEIHKNTTLYASFGFAVNFYTHDGTKFYSTIVPEGKKLEEPEIPVREYYEFDDWYVDEELTSLYDFNNDVTSEFDLYAGFTALHYNIVYHNVENATNNNPETYQYTIGLESLNDASKQGYRFYGWYTDEQLTNKLTSIDPDSHETINLYAYFSKEYSISYVNWPADIPNPNPTSFTVEEPEDLDFDPFGDLPGISLVSYVDQDGVTRSKANVDHNLQLTVNYETTQTYVTFDANGGQVVGLDNYIYLNSMIPGEGPVKYEVPASTNTKSDGFNPNEHVPDYKGHIFKGWYLDSGFNTPINKNSLTLVASGQTLYAKWEEVQEGRFTIKDKAEYNPGWTPRPYYYTGFGRFDLPYNVGKVCIYYFASCSNGSVTMSSNAIYEGEPEVAHSIYMSKPNQDFIFDDVTVDVTNDVAISFGVALSYESANFDECLPMYSVEIKVEGYRSEYIKVGPQSSVTLNVNFWDSITLPLVEREGYKFDGWYYGDMLIDIGYHFPLIEKSVTLKAHWTKNS